MKKINYIQNSSINIIFLIIKRNLSLIKKFLMIKKNILLNFINLIFVTMIKCFFYFKQDDQKIFSNHKLFNLSKKNFCKV